jgi:hypothetical protein
MKFKAVICRASGVLSLPEKSTNNSTQPDIVDAGSTQPSAEVPLALKY